MIGWGVDVGPAVDKQHRNRDVGGRDHGADRVNVKVTLFLRKLKRALDHSRRKEEWCPDDRVVLTIPLADGVVIDGVKKPRTR
jgi:hypothetical protein